MFNYWSEYNIAICSAQWDINANKDLYRDSLAITSNNISLGILMQTKLPRSQVTVRELCVSFVTRK